MKREKDGRPPAVPSPLRLSSWRSSGRCAASRRHTTGTEAARQNLAAPIIQNILRHSKITTTQKYIHLASEDTHRGANQLSGAPKKDEEPREAPSPDQAAS